jgi:hypothetical protein
VSQSQEARIQVFHYGCTPPKPNFNSLAKIAHIVFLSRKKKYTTHSDSRSATGSATIGH